MSDVIIRPMDILCQQYMLHSFSYNISAHLKRKKERKNSFDTNFSPADNLRSKLAVNDQKINKVKVIFLLV